ncbi:MAG TPA: MBL fold metallo-hydrolase [Cyclobacteriaceae bacterium]|nr:MBL fold metallo-hydrolase [Cyclobacteriaceae bacterium]
MKVTFLGTGTSQGVPVIGCDCEVCSSLDFRDKRLRSSVHLQVGAKSLVIDTGPDFRQQMLREGIKRLDAIIYTHEHKDHTAGLDDIRPFNFSQHADMPIYAQASVLEQIKREFSYIFSDRRYPGIPMVETCAIDNHPFNIDGIGVQPIRVLHHKLPVFGYRINDFTYITDANHIPPEEMEKIKGTRVLVINALQHQPHISHFTLAQALEVAEALQPERTYLTHISHKLGLHREVEETLPPGVFIGYDGLKITLD